MVHYGGTLCKIVMAPDVQTHITWSTLPERGFFSLYEFSLFSLIFAGSSSNFDIIWCRIQFCLCFSHLNLKIPSIFTLFSKFLSSHGHFVKSGELSTKRTKSQGRQAKHYVGRASRAICALNNVNIAAQQCKHCESGPKSLLPLLKCNIPKKYRKCPKSPIICLSTLSGRGYQVMSRFRLGVPDRKVAQLWCSVSVISFSKSFKIG